MNYLVLGVDSYHDYSFYTPLTCLMARRMNFHPIVFLVGTPESWLDVPRLRMVVERTRSIGVTIYFTGDIEGHRTSTVAQVSRLFGAALPGLATDDMLTTADMDMWLLGDWVGSSDDKSGSISMYGGNAYAGEARLHFPMCYLRAPVSTWRELMGCKAGSFRESLVGALSHCPTDSTGAWNFDEAYFGDIIAKWSGYPSRCQIIDRTFRFGQRRMDRSGWDLAVLNEATGSPSLNGFADAHLFRPGYNDENWNRLLPVLKLALTDRWLKWAEDYRAEWVRLS